MLSIRIVGCLFATSGEQAVGQIDSATRAVSRDQHGLQAVEIGELGVGSLGRPGHAAERVVQLIEPLASDPSG